MQRTDIPQNCSVGYHSGSGATACINCTVGFSWSVSTSSCVLNAIIGPAESIPCPVGYYGVDPACSACPPHTNSSTDHTSTLLDCRCLPGYLCSYTKRISVVLTLHNISWDMLNPVTLSQSSVIDAIAQAAGVSKENVHINGMFSGRRRLLQDLQKHKLFITVKEADTLNLDLAYSLLNIDSHISWEHSHSLHVAREQPTA